MKIVIIHHFGNMGGGTNSCIDIARILQSLGHNVTVCIDSPKQDVIEILRKHNLSFRIDVPQFVLFNYHNASRSSLKALYKFISSKRFVDKWEEYIKSLEPDIVFLNSIVQCPLADVVKKTGVKCVCFVRETIYRNNNTYCNKLIKKHLQKTDATVFLTDYDLQSWGLDSSIKQFVIPDIVDESRFSIDENLMYVLEQEKKKTLWEYSLLYLGGYNYAKGAKNILEAVEIVRDYGINVGLYILGDCENRFLNENIFLRLLHGKLHKYIEDCHRIVKRLNAQTNCVKEIGITARPEEWLYLCDAVVFPVNQVHQARPVYEAGFFGKPAIVPDFPNFRGVVDNGVNGLLYNVGSTHDLAKRIIDLSRNTDLSIALGQSNREYTEKRHTIRSAIDLVEELLRSI